MGSRNPREAMQHEYMDLIVQAYLKKKNDKYTIVVSDFVKETGVQTRDIVSYLNARNWQERTIGLYQQN